jgi:hypothetical protein
MAGNGAGVAVGAAAVGDTGGIIVDVMAATGKKWDEK